MEYPSPIFTVTSIPGSSFFVTGNQFHVYFWRMPDDSSVLNSLNTLHYPVQGTNLGQNKFKSAQWFPAQRKMLLTLIYGQELWWIIGNDSCSIECSAHNDCSEEKPFLADGCGTCKEGGAAPVDGKCPAPSSGEYSATTATLTGGNGAFQTTDNIKAASVGTLSNTPDAGSIVLTKNLQTVEDPERSTAHLIGAIIAGVAVLAVLCTLIYCCMRRRKKKKLE